MMINLFYPHLHDSNGAETHRRGLISGFEANGWDVVSRNQFSRLDSFKFFWDAVLRRKLYVRMNLQSKNVRLIFWILIKLKCPYVLEVNAPCSEDNSNGDLYEVVVRRATMVICVSSTLKQYLLRFNSNVLTVANGGLPSDRHCTENEKPHFLFIYNAHWHWQRAAKVVSMAKVLESIGFQLKVVDVANRLRDRVTHDNIQILDSLTSEEYRKALTEASAFFVEYDSMQDGEIGFYLDSLKYRDFWNSDKVIVIEGPKMSWAPNPQSKDFGIFTFSEFANAPMKNLNQRVARKSYTWKDACHRILDRLETFPPKITKA